MSIYVCSWSFALYCTNIVGAGERLRKWWNLVQILKEPGGEEESFPDRRMVEGWEAELIPSGTAQ